jgi:hypothetical protein
VVVFTNGGYEEPWKLWLINVLVPSTENIILDALGKLQVGSRRADIWKRCFLRLLPALSEQAVLLELMVEVSSFHDCSGESSLPGLP